MDVHPEKSILGILKSHPEGLTITSIASLANLHRHTVTKYVKNLILSGRVQERYVGMAKLCYLSKHAPNDKDMGKKAETGQVQILLLFLLLLAIPVLIIAQTIGNSTTTTTGDFAEIIDSLNDTSSSSFLDSTSASSSSTTSTVETTTILVENIQNYSENSTDNTSLVVDGVANITQENSKFSNETATNDTTTTTTENTTIPPTTIETTTLETTTVDTTTILPESYSIDVIVEAPEKITRGQSLNLKSIVTNNLLTDTPITVTWILPDGFDLVSGSSVYICGIVQPAQSCVADINVSTSLSTDVGLRQIRVVVSYG